jgi:hypothetical protein
MAGVTADIRIDPDVDDAIRIARDALDAEARRAEVMGDPSAGMLRAQAQMLAAQHRMMVDASLAMTNLIEKAKQPNDEMVIRQAVHDCFRNYLRHLVRMFNWSAIAVCVAVIVVSFGAGYGWRWWGEGATRYAGIRQGPDVCEDRPDGQLCRIPVFLPKQ